MDFENISGYETEKKELISLRKMLLNAEEYKKKGIRIPRGIALCGQPGVGKSVMARSIADENISLIELRAADCCNDETDSAIRAAFENAKKNTPSILLLDELDKLAGTSGMFYMEGNDEVKKILLQELDGLTASDNVLVVATCNNTRSLGRALLRPGRFDRIIEVEAPDEATRIKILNHYFSRLNINKAVDIGYIAKITGGYTGAMLECLVNETGILVMNAGRKRIVLNDIKTVMNRMSFEGYEKEPTNDIDELKSIAVHEAGHALVAMYKCPEYLQGASILPQGLSGGHIDFIADEDAIPSISNIEKEIMVLLAGRVAERTVLEDLRLGSENDLGRAATKMMYLIATQAAYGYKYMLCAIGNEGSSGIVSEDVKSELGRKFEEKMMKLDIEAETIIRENRTLFDSLVEELMTKRVLSREELFEIKQEFSAAA